MFGALGVHVTPRKRLGVFFYDLVDKYAIEDFGNGRLTCEKANPCIELARKKLFPKRRYRC